MPADRRTPTDPAGTSATHRATRSARPTDRAIPTTDPTIPTTEEPS